MYEDPGRTKIQCFLSFQALLPKFKEALSHGLGSLKFYVSYGPKDQQTNGKPVSDYYNSRPLPFIIGG